MLTQSVPDVQFSGPSAEQMRKTYSEFCSRHTKALKLYKELYARDKRFQQFIRVSEALQAWGAVGFLARPPMCARPLAGAVSFSTEAALGDRAGPCGCPGTADSSGWPPWP